MKKKKIIIIILILVLFLIVVPFGISIFLYNQFLGVRYETDECFLFSLSDFPELKRNKYEFISNKGQKLVGYHYYSSKDNIKGIIVFAHGFGGGGHNSYMDCANYFTKNGYYVFAFDATGNDESEGKCVGGLPQGVIDLDYAITFIEGQEEFKDLPVMLFGHSWGGYSVTNVLNYHPEIKAVVSLAGFNKSSDLIEAQGEKIVGVFSHILIPYINAYEKLKFGKYASNTAMNAFENSNTQIMVIHSLDDDTVPKKYGYDIYYEKYKNSPRFKFIEYEDKGHSSIYCSKEAISYVKVFNESFEEYFSGSEITKEKRIQYINENFDRDILTNLIDTELFDEIREFYNSSIEV